MIVATHFHSYSVSGCEIWWNLGSPNNIINSNYVEHSLD